jgi:hypothetical protein
LDDYVLTKDRDVGYWALSKLVKNDGYRPIKNIEAETVFLGADGHVFYIRNGELTI